MNGIGQRISPKGLGDPPYVYLARVKAEGIPGSGLSDSAFSENLIIIDTPITHADGKSSHFGVNRGQVELTWKAIETVLGDIGYANGKYHFKYRRLGGNDTVANWNAHDYEETFTTEDDKVSNQTSYTVEGLIQNRIYAIQLRYELPKRAGAKDVGRVYAARDVYAWPSRQQPVSIRTGSFPMFGHWSDRQVHYKICDDTFQPVTRPSDWVALITHAFQQWEKASADLITMHPTSGSCGFDNSPMSSLRSMYNRTNEVYMIDHESWDTFLHDWMEIAINPLFQCIQGSASACVISPDYLHPGKGPMLNLGRTAIFGQSPGSVDVLIQQQVATTRLSEPNIPGADLLWSVDDVIFNICQPREPGANPDSSYFAYALMVHEAGHLIGLSGLNLDVLDTDDARGHFEMSHPTLPESVLNYDDQIPHFWDQGIVGMDRQVSWEPDCSPHPFDLMALNALYQTVNRSAK